MATSCIHNNPYNYQLYGNLQSPYVSLNTVSVCLSVCLSVCPRRFLIVRLCCQSVGECFWIALSRLIQELCSKVYCAFPFGQEGGSSARVSVLVIFFILFLERGANSKKNGAKKNWGQNLKFLKKSILVFVKCAIWLF